MTPDCVDVLRTRHGGRWQCDSVLPGQRVQLLPGRIGDWHSVALASGAHRQLRLPGKEHGFYPFGGQAVRHRGALRLDLGPESLQIGEAGNIDGQDEWTVDSTRAVVARRIHLCQTATDELGEEAESAPFVPTEWHERTAGVEIARVPLSAVLRDRRCFPRAPEILSLGPPAACPRQRPPWRRRGRRAAHRRPWARPRPWDSCPSPATGPQTAPPRVRRWPSPDRSCPRGQSTRRRGRRDRCDSCGGRRRRRGRARAPGRSRPVVASHIAGWPQPSAASTIAVAPDCDTRLGTAAGTTCPCRAPARYAGRRRTPCES